MDLRVDAGQGRPVGLAGGTTGQIVGLRARFARVVTHLARRAIQNPERTACSSDSSDLRTSHRVALSIDNQSSERVAGRGGQDEV